MSKIVLVSDTNNLIYDSFKEALVSYIGSQNLIYLKDTSMLVPTLKEAAVDIVFLEYTDSVKELISIIRDDALLSHLIIILTYGGRKQLSLSVAKDLGADDILEKPFEVIEVRQKIDLFHANTTYSQDLTHINIVDPVMAELLASASNAIQQTKQNQEDSIEEREQQSPIHINNPLDTEQDDDIANEFNLSDLDDEESSITAASSINKEERTLLLDEEDNEKLTSPINIHVPDTQESNDFQNKPATPDQYGILAIPVVSDTPDSSLNLYEEEDSQDDRDLFAAEEEEAEAVSLFGEYNDDLLPLESNFIFEDDTSEVETDFTSDNDTSEEEPGFIFVEDDSEEIKLDPDFTFEEDSAEIDLDPDFTFEENTSEDESDFLFEENTSDNEEESDFLFEEVTSEDEDESDFLFEEDTSENEEESDFLFQDSSNEELVPEPNFTIEEDSEELQLEPNFIVEEDSNEEIQLDPDFSFEEDTTESDIFVDSNEEELAALDNINTLQQPSFIDTEDQVEQEEDNFIFSLENYKSNESDTFSQKLKEAGLHLETKRHTDMSSISIPSDDIHAHIAKDVFALNDLTMSDIIPDEDKADAKENRQPSLDKQALIKDILERATEDITKIIQK